MSPPAVNWPPAPVSTTNRTDVVAVELGEELCELVAREHRDPVELPRHVQRDRRHAALGVVLDPESVVLAHSLSFDLVAQDPAQDLSRCALRERRHQTVLARALEARERRGEAVRVELLGRRVADDDRDDPAAEAVVGSADDRHLAHAGVAREDVLDLDRMDVLAARDDHVVDAGRRPRGRRRRRDARCRRCGTSRRESPWRRRRAGSSSRRTPRRPRGGRRSPRRARASAAC